MAFESSVSFSMVNPVVVSLVSPSVTSVLSFFGVSPLHERKGIPLPTRDFREALQLSAPKSQQFLRFAIAMPIADPRHRSDF